MIIEVRCIPDGDDVNSLRGLFSNAAINQSEATYKEQLKEFNRLVASIAQAAFTAGRKYERSQADGTGNPTY